MEKKLLQKYASFLLRDCLKLKKNQPLLIAANKLNESFVAILKEEAKKISSGEVYTILKDSFEEREMFLHKSYEECIESPLLDRHLYNEIAEKDGVLLSLSSLIPHINDSVDSKLLKDLSAEMERRITVFREKQMKGEIPWCIAGCSNPYWAKEIFPNEENPEEALWERILNICLIDKDNPGQCWNEYFEELERRCYYLNSLQIKSLHYTASNGTDITFELPKNYVFVSAKDSNFVANMPSLEIFATPKKTGTNGIIYSSKPLFRNGIKIDDFWLRFEEGRVVEAKAKVNDEHFQQMIDTDEGAHYLGEISFVDFDSRINQSGVLFENTLFDENACCHLALGKGFSECFVDGQQKSKEKLIEMGMNDSLIHVDFMVGTRDLKIVATLQNGDTITIMEQGKIVI